MAVSGVDAGLICRAAQLEEKWAERDSDGNPVVETVRIMNVGVHPGNRGGVYTQGMAVSSLWANIIKDGFHKGHANAGGIAVRERPPTAVNVHVWNSFSEYNIEASSGIYDATHSIQYAALAHCHLLNLHRCILTRRMFDGQELSTTALAAHPNL